MNKFKKGDLVWVAPYDKDRRIKLMQGTVTATDGALVRVYNDGELNIYPRSLVYKNVDELIADLLRHRDDILASVYEEFEPAFVAYELASGADPSIRTTYYESDMKK